MAITPLLFNTLLTLYIFFPHHLYISCCFSTFCLTICPPSAPDVLSTFLSQLSIFFIVTESIFYVKPLCQPLIFSVFLRLSSLKNLSGYHAITIRINLFTGKTRPGIRRAFHKTVICIFEKLLLFYCLHCKQRLSCFDLTVCQKAYSLVIFDLCAEDRRT